MPLDMEASSFHFFVQDRQYVVWVYTYRYALFHVYTFETDVRCYVAVVLIQVYVSLNACFS